MIWESKLGERGKHNAKTVSIYILQIQSLVIMQTGTTKFY